MSAGCRDMVLAHTEAEARVSNSRPIAQERRSPSRVPRSSARPAAVIARPASQRRLPRPYPDCSAGERTRRGRRRLGLGLGETSARNAPGISRRSGSRHANRFDEIGPGRAVADRQVVEFVAVRNIWRRHGDAPSPRSRGGRETGGGRTGAEPAARRRAGAATRRRGRGRAWRAGAWAAGWGTGAGAAAGSWRMAPGRWRGRAGRTSRRMRFVVAPSLLTSTKRTSGRVGGRR